jgi:DNA-binding NarL/FixJ family response regulator
MTIKILLVDDNQTFVTAVGKFLKMLPGTEVVGQALDGREALVKARQLQPNLMLLDISMPELNGLEVARCMQSWPQPPRVVFLSMHDSVAYRDAAHDLGAAGFVDKANFVVELLPIVERMVAHDAVKDASC